uniref:Uncharacterized protein n=1 Tax=Populus trichocarpa TaxID=3694 RepID=A0A2K2CAI8_POPTR
MNLVILSSNKAAARKIKHDLYIDCSDEGVYFIEAQMKTFHLSTFLEKNGEPLYAPVLSLKPSRFIKIRKGKCAWRRFVFDALAIRQLKAEAS